MPTTTINLNKHELVSVNYLERHLKDGFLFAYNNFASKQWEIFSQKTRYQTVERDEFNNTRCEKCVLVGQLINIQTLQRIAEHRFTSAKYIVVSPHHLHNEFSQQAIVLELYFADNSATHFSSDADQFVTNELMLSISKDYFLDCFALSDISLSTPGLLVMDMDSTIINMECIDEIAALAGVGDKVSELTERAMQGELDFNQSLQARLSCLAGIAISDLDAIKSRLPINPGFAKTIKYLHNNGWTTCIASGGFTYFADHLKEVFGLTHAYSNVLTIEQGLLTGGVEGEIVNAQKKQQILLELREQYKIAQRQTIAIGDGANDLLMMQAATLGVAYKAKPKVQRAADANIHFCGFEGILYCLQA